MTELQQFIAMLEKAWIGHGLRDDHNPRGTAVLVETGYDGEHFTAEFVFDAAGQLKSVECYETEVG